MLATLLIRSTPTDMWAPLADLVGPGWAAVLGPLLVVVAAFSAGVLLHSFAHRWRTR